MDSKKKILVTGASGLIGSHLVNLLLKQGFFVKGIVHRRDLQLPKNENLEIVQGDLTYADFCSKICEGIDQVYHLAVETGSIVKNSKHPAGIMTPTILMDFHMLKAAHEKGVKRYLYSSCACVYPSEIEDMREDQAWNGPPPKMHETLSWAKRISELQCQSYHKEFGDEISIVRPSNTFGPYDIFDEENSHVISAFIKRAVNKTNPFVIWGNGEQIREFVFAEDIAKGMILAIEKSTNADPINLGGGTSIKIKDLAKIITELVGYSPSVKFDTTKPTGHLKRILNSEKARNELGFIPTTSLEQGLKKTLSWYLNNN